MGWIKDECNRSEACMQLIGLSDDMAPFKSSIVASSAMSIERLSFALSHVQCESPIGVIHPLLRHPIGPLVNYSAITGTCRTPTDKHQLGSTTLWSSRVQNYTWWSQRPRRDRRNNRLGYVVHCSDVYRHLAIDRTQVISHPHGGNRIAWAFWSLT
jgi:hypothetical protein